MLASKLVQHSAKQRGFTLIELLVVVALIAVTAGVSTDIVVSLVRSYSKTKVTNEIESAGNLAMLKLTKELRTASFVYTGEGQTDADTLLIERTVKGSPVYVMYEVTPGNTLQRAEDDNLNDLQTNPVFYPLMSTGANATIELTNTTFFEVLQTGNPYIVKLTFTFEQSDSLAAQLFTGALTFEEVVVVRGSY